MSSATIGPVTQSHRAVLDDAHERAVVPYAATREGLRAQVRDKQITWDEYQETITGAPLTRATDIIRSILVPAIPDTFERAQAVASVIVPATNALEEARIQRDLASLHLAAQGWAPVEVYTLTDVSRGLFVRTRRKAPAKLPPVRNPKATAIRATADVARYEPVVEAWRPFRDETIWDLLDARPDLTNAELGRMFGVEGQRITIMRKKGR